MANVITRSINYTDVMVIRANEISDDNGVTGIETTSETLQFKKSLNTLLDMRKAVRAYYKFDNFIVVGWTKRTGRYQMDFDTFMTNAKVLSDYPDYIADRVRMVKVQVGDTTAQVVTPEILANQSAPITVTYPSDMKPRALGKLISEKVGTKNYMVLSTVENNTIYAMPINKFIELANEVSADGDETDETDAEN
jgi:hypothetical protein